MFEDQTKELKESWRDENKLASLEGLDQICKPLFPDKCE
jgi:hypothetical protein